MWKVCPLNQNYSVNTEGQIKNNRTGRILKPWKIKVGYYVIRLGLNGKHHQLHRIVSITFIPTDNYKLDVNHKDGNKLNNRVDNLEWITRSQNCQHAYDNNLSKRRFGHKDSVGSKNSMSIVTEELVKEIRSKYKTGNYTYQKLGEEYNIHLATIGYIIQRKTWKHVEE